MMKPIPAMSALHYFYVVAQLNSFTLAAEALCVTQSAVSKQIKSLEDSLKFDLFKRKSRGVELTPEGAQLFDTVAFVFAQLNGTISGIQSSKDRNQIKIFCTEAVAHYWLVPRLHDFYQQYPDIKINVISSNDLSLGDIDDFDLGILYGSGHWPSVSAAVLFAEVVYPICHIDYPIATIQQPQDFLAHKLIQLNPVLWRWANWADWMGYFDVAYEPTKEVLIYNQATLALAACMNQQGIALGWEFMVKDLLSNRLLKRAGEMKLVSGKHDYLIHAKNKPLSAAAQLFKAWLLAKV